ncbi:MAG: InlB B-repeat-containing protein, partial [Blautia sp.]|nr:InlB B-repeat-containing protein [Blautia sp.]
MRAKRKQKEPISILLLMLVLLLGVARFFFPMGCQAATTYKVYFRENGGGKGTDGQMSRLTVTVKKGKKVILPELPEKQGYLSLGWTSVKKGTSVEYRPGESVTIKSATTFYAVRQKRVKCKVKFKNNKGTSGKSPYKELAMTVYAGDKAVLPKVPPYAGYEGLGWTTTKAGTSPLYLEGSEVTVEDSITYYAVR